MITYKYNALSIDGAKINGVIEAVDEYHAVEKIKEDNNAIVLDIKEVKTGGIYDILHKEVGKKTDAKALSVMCSQFAIILNAGTPINQTIKMIETQTEDKRLRKMLNAAYFDVNHGSTIEQAFRKNYDGLPEVFLETIKAGEQSGTLAKSFENMQAYFDKAFKTNQKLKSVTAYPLFVLTIAIIVLIVVMVMVVPTLTSVFSELGGELPIITQILIGISNWFAKYWLIIVAILLLVVVGYKIFTKSEDGKIKAAEGLLKLPVIGKIVTLTSAQEFANIMATLLEAGLTVSDSLRVTSKCLSNYAVSREVFAMAEKVETGNSLSSVMGESKYLPDTLKEMTGIGEKSGELVKTLHTIGDYYANETDYATKSALGKLEPVLLVLLAIFAGFIVIAIYMPMFTMYSMI